MLCDYFTRVCGLRYILYILDFVYILIVGGFYSEVLVLPFCINSIYILFIGIKYAV
jgi:hypothetical protein